ncbi:glycosyltransferase family 4 protein [Alteromonas gracilis]|uniref:glycosyltransferase family 4 protein n=1 Tax=Alteromonas gracilis TaxID=1479524 RepID=UPI0030D18997
MKVLHVTYDMRIGGTEMVIKNIIEGNTDPDIKMSIFCIESPLGPWGHELQKTALIDITVANRKPGFDFELIQQLRNHIKTNTIDIVHCHQYTPWVYGALAAMGSSARVIFTEHGRFYPDTSSWKRKIINPLLMQLTQQVTAISRATKEALKAFENIPLNKIKLVYNGILPLSSPKSDVETLKETLGIPNDFLVFGTVSRMDPIKNHKLMVRAFAEFNQTFPNSILLLVGDGEEKETIVGLIEQYSLSSNVILTGYIKKPVNHIAALDVFLLPSFSEGTSMTLLEAMSLSKPSIVTDVGGNPEVVQHAETGIVIKNNNLKDLVSAMKTLATDRQSRELLGRNAKLRFDDMFSLDKMCKAYKALYQKR